MIRKSTEVRTPITYGYARVSHKDGRAKAESVPAQAERIKAYYQKNLSELAEWGDVFDDGKEMSAYRYPFHRRPAGRRLLAHMEKGDYLIVDRVDRLWRSVKDFCRLMELLDSRGIILHIEQFIGGETFNTNSPMGRWVMQMWVAFAELESIQKSDRIKEGKAAVRKQGKSSGSRPPMGTRRVTRGRRKTSLGVYVPVRYLVWDEKVREFMRFIVDVKLGHFWNEERLRCVAKKEAEIFGTPEITSLSKLKYLGLSCNRWGSMYRNECAFRFLSIEHTSQIPKVKVLVEAARQYELRCGTAEDGIVVGLGQTTKGVKIGGLRRWKRPIVPMTVEEVLAIE